MDSFVHPFHGLEVGVSVEVFWSKFLIVVKLQKRNDDAAKMASISLFLGGEAFLVRDELLDDEKDADTVKSALEAPFSLTHLRRHANNLHREI